MTRERRSSTAAATAASLSAEAATRSGSSKDEEKLKRSEHAVAASSAPQELTDGEADGMLAQLLRQQQEFQRMQDAKDKRRRLDKPLHLEESLLLHDCIGGTGPLPIPASPHNSAGTTTRKTRSSTKTRTNSLSSPNGSEQQEPSTATPAQLAHEQQSHLQAIRAIGGATAVASASDPGAAKEPVVSAPIVG